MIRPKNQTEYLILSVIENSETLIQQTHTKPQETLEFKITKPEEIFSLEPYIVLGLEFKKMIRLRSLEVEIAISNITEENNKFELYTETFDEFPILELKDEVAGIFGFSNTTLKLLQLL